MISSLFDLGAVGEHGASGSPGKDSFHMIIILCLFFGPDCVD